ncbi:MAG TPA: Rieske (2Fe-2S) protein [Streptosporangiaceae bacterium]
MTWQAVMLAEDLWEGELTGVQLAGKKFVLLNAGGDTRAYEDRCPHAGFQLSEGYFDGCTLTCVNRACEPAAQTGLGGPALCIANQLSSGLPSNM